jgi:mRNA interferase RelE/StbE
VKRYEVELKPRALRAVQEELPAKIVDVVLYFINGPLRENPKRVGKLLDAPFRDTWSARRGDYRIIYVIHKEPAKISVLDIKHRSHVYATRFLDTDK